KNAELLKQVMEKDAKRNVENIELKFRVRKLEVRLAILEQNITEVSAVDIFDSVIDQQNDVKSIKDNKIGDFIPKESANISDSVEESIPKESSVDDQMARTQIYDKMELYLPGKKREYLRKMTQKTKNIYTLFKGIGIDKVGVVISSVDVISRLTDA
ncbi:6980_t:CDS:2, partial [Funneliformis geosporum]